MGQSSRAPKRVAVLMGGPSAEREVSLSSGRECANALREAGYEVVEVDAGRDLPSVLHSEQPDVVFNALHGRWGEDGCVQGMLEWLRIPYTHSGVLSSALAMDKQRTKDAYGASGLPFVESRLACRAEIEGHHVMEPPYVVKPYNEGSSVGVYIVTEAANGPPTLAPDLPEILMVERYAAGRELTTTVMGDRALTVTDIITDGWYDYHAKYAAAGRATWCRPRSRRTSSTPAWISPCARIAALGCRGLSRTDFRWDEARGMDGLILLETNTQPGMTPTSLAPEQAAACGIGFRELCAWLVEDASCGR